MAKPRHPADNRPGPTEGAGDWGAEAGVTAEEAEEVGGTQGDEVAGTPPIEVSTSGKSYTRPLIVWKRQSVKIPENHYAIVAMIA